MMYNLNKTLKNDAKITIPNLYPKGHKTAIKIDIAGQYFDFWLNYLKINSFKNLLKQFFFDKLPFLSNFLIEIANFVYNSNRANPIIYTSDIIHKIVIVR